MTSSLAGFMILVALELHKLTITRSS
uniref:(California timema) hypothetical protein n=1 Tax=Timema californicum TaxID=61474 RepID=A0A7R9P896_TIMCA|nr:unnamed protein product [Timema californicum]